MITFKRRPIHCDPVNRWPLIRQRSQSGSRISCIYHWILLCIKHEAWDMAEASLYHTPHHYYPVSNFINSIWCDFNAGIASFNERHEDEILCFFLALLVSYTFSSHTIASVADAAASHCRRRRCRCCCCCWYFIYMRVTCVSHSH